MSLKNKVALITGSGTGIGAATALLFAEEGADVVIVDKNEAGAINTGKEVEDTGKKALVIIADLTKDVEARKIITRTIDTFGKLDILINNVGTVIVGNIIDGKIMESYDEVMNINLRATVLMTSLAAPHLIESKGVVVNVSSAVPFGIKHATKCPAYCIAKAGVNTLTQTAALELAKAGVRVNAVAPGPVNTNTATVSGFPNKIEDYIDELPLCKMSEPCEIADLLLYLASDKAKSITGSCYVIDNGMLLN